MDTTLAQVKRTTSHKIKSVAKELRKQQVMVLRGREACGNPAPGMELEKDA
jgi:hypothetical protein